MKSTDGGGNWIERANQQGIKLWKHTLDLVFKPHCLSCRNSHTEGVGLCSNCWGRLNFLGPPECLRCGIPFELLDPSSFDLQELLCGSCVRKPPIFQHHRSILTYDEASKKLILPFKHSDCTDLAPLFGSWLSRRLSDLPDRPELIIPVPLHPIRLLQRRYNQTALLSVQLSRATGIPNCPLTLVRIRNTASQGAIKTGSRYRNVRDAFSVRRTEKIVNKHVLLLDDVYTTGATLNECSSTLLSQGAASISALTIAKVVHTH